jgi:hypothetical protein
MLGKFLLRLNSVIYILLLSGMGVLFFVLPKKAVSEYEKRPLSSFPNYSWEKLANGKFVDSIDLYYSDNFPFRDDFVALAFQIKQHRGLVSKDIAFYNESIDFDAGTENLKGKNDSLAEDGDESEISFYNDGDSKDVKNLSQGLLIYNGMAIQIFGGSKSTATYLSKAVNEIRRNLPDDVNVYLGITPTHGEFYLPSEYADKRTSERKLIDTAYGLLDPSVKSFDITAELFKHKNEYIFFNTDHHWTGTGAYYAYVAFCKKTGLTPVPLSEMRKGVIPRFLGTLYRNTRDKRLENNIDSVVYHKVPISNVTYQLVGKGYGQIQKSNLYVENARGGNAYGVYLGGDIPAVCIVSKQQNGKRLLILKNSFGNALAPYLVSHFERTYVCDYRYFECNLKDFIEKNEITDLLIFHNSFSANTPSHVDMLRQIAKSQTLCVAHKLPDWEDMFPEGKLLESVLDKHKKEVSKDSSGGSNKKSDTKKNKNKNTTVKKTEPEKKPETEQKPELEQKVDTTAVNGQ